MSKEYSDDQDAYHVIATSQKTLIEQLLKDLVLNLDLTQRLMSKVEHHFESSKNDFMTAKDMMHQRTLKDWKVEIQYRLDMEAYCQEKRLQPTVMNLGNTPSYQQTIKLLS